MINAILIANNHAESKVTEICAIFYISPIFFLIFSTVFPTICTTGSSEMTISLELCRGETSFL